jgi:putative ABC transport system substrate-binding protein
MSAIADPLGSGFIQNLAHPGGNFTGLSSFVTDLEAKRVEMLKEMIPELKRLATVADFSNPANAKSSHFSAAQRSGRTRRAHSSAPSR